MGTEYEGLSDEYYDDRAHPTIAIMRAGSRLALDALAQELTGAGGGLIAEVGSGRGSLHAIAGNTCRILCFDLNLGMLRAVPHGIVADATALPLAAKTLDGVFASLCDPYNTLQFLREARRVLKHGGRLLMTVPDHRWVRHNQLREGVADAAVISTRTGPVTVPSIVHEPEHQTLLLRECGFHEVRVRHIPLDVALERAGTTSPRLLDDNGVPVSSFIVTAYLAR